MELESVLITGANRGLGLAMVKYFATMQPRGPSHIVATCRDQLKCSELQKLAEEKKNIYIIQLDVRDDKKLLNAVHEVENILGGSGLNLLINNAAVLELDGSVWPNIKRNCMQHHFEVNGTSPLLVSQAFLPLLIKAAQKSLQNGLMSVNKSAIINMTSIEGCLSPHDTRLLGVAGYGYSASKCALNMVTKCLSTDLRDHGILVAAFCPGGVDTDMVRHVRENRQKNHVPAAVGPKPRGYTVVKPVEAAERVITSMFQLTNEHTGGIFHADGRPMP